MNKIHAFQGKQLLENINVVIERLTEAAPVDTQAAALVTIAKGRAESVRDMLLRLLISDATVEPVEADVARGELQIARAA